MKCAFIYACGTGFIINDTNGLSVDLSGVWRWQGAIIGNPALLWWGRCWGSTVDPLSGI